MLSFFRKYQHYIYVLITIVIVISFSFFGTYSALPNHRINDPVAFTDVKGNEIRQSQLEKLVFLLKLDYPQGVLSQDLLQSGIGLAILEKHPQLVKKDFDERSQIEKKYRLYTHPQAQYISVEQIWQTYAPEMKQYFDRMKQVEDPVSRDAMANRINFYLAQQHVPFEQVRNILRYQQKQYSWLQQDPHLEYQDMSLYGYKTAEDWFGRHFLNLAAEFIINSAAIAEQHGYSVSSEEALQSLVTTLHQLDPTAFNTQQVDLYLQRMGLDRLSAADLWGRVVLFQRMFRDVGGAVAVAPQPFEEYLAYATEGIKGNVYQLPSDLQLGRFRDMQKLDLYLASVAPAPKGTKPADQLLMPSTYFSVDQVAKTTPELVQKRYLVDVSKVDLPTLQSKISVKEAWGWEVETENWEKLKKRFPELGVKKAETADERIAVLDGLDSNTRSQIDTYARTQIVEAHPESIDAALSKVTPERKVVSLRKRGGTMPFAGLTKGAELMDLLDKAPLDRDDFAELNRYSADGKTYYRIRVIDRSPSSEVMTFAQADEAGVLDELLNTKLENDYITHRKDVPQGYQNPDGSWKLFHDVRDQVAEKYFAKTLKALTEYQKSNGVYKNLKENGTPTPSMLAAIRLHPHLQHIVTSVKADPNQIDRWVRPTQSENPHLAALPPQEGLDDQWKLAKVPYETNRHTEDLSGKNGMFDLVQNQWSELFTSPNGEIFFFHLLERGSQIERKLLVQNVMKAQELLSQSAQVALADKLLNVMGEKKALSLDFMVRVDEIQEGN